MLLIVLAAVLVLGIAFYQVVQGIFSAMIMTILSVLCALIAFNYYEPLAQAILAYGQYQRNPAFVFPASLMAVFFVSLLALRILFDRLISSSVTFGVWADRIGGGALGLVTGMVLVGVLAIALQMLPWDAAILGYKPYDNSLQHVSSLAPFDSDRFVLGLVDKCSAASLAQGDKRFGQVHPDYLLELQAQRNRCELPGRNDAKPDADTLKISGVYAYKPQNLPDWLEKVPSYPTTDKTEPETTYIIRTNVSLQTADADGWYRLPGTQFRLVMESGKSYYPVAFLTFPERSQPGESPWRPIYRVTNGLAEIGWLAVERTARDAPSGLTVDWVYKVPAAEKPETLVFRMMTRTKLPAAGETFPTNNPLWQAQALKRR